LLEIGIVVEPSSFRAAVGYWRTDPRADCYRWEAIGVFEGRTYNLGSYDTMTECARVGVQAEFDILGSSLEVSAAPDPRPGRI
jgi:hypothetical protein